MYHWHCIFGCIEFRPSLKIPWTPWDHMSYFPWEGGRFPYEACHFTLKPTSHGDISCKSRHFPWGSDVNAHHPMWVTWDGLYPMGMVFISHGILFPYERQSHAKDLLSRVKNFLMGNIFPWKRFPQGKYVPMEKSLVWNIFPCDKSKKGGFSLNNYLLLCQL